MIALGHEDGTIGLANHIGTAGEMGAVKVVAAKGDAPVMDVCWRWRNSLLEPHFMIACRPDGSVTKWSSVIPGKFETTILNPDSQFMALDCSSIARTYALAG